VVAATDPATLPDLTTFYLLTNLASPEGDREAGDRELAAADLAEVAQLYALRSWIEQSYKQVKNSLGWAHYQVRSALAIRRHWQLVCCAFCFCWWAWPSPQEVAIDVGSPPAAVVLEEESSSSTTIADEEGADGGKRKAQKTEPPPPPPVTWPRALRKVRAWLQPYVMLQRYWRAYTDLPPPKQLEALLDRLFCAEGLRLSVH
jgi:Transposase DDE domain